MKEKRIKLSIMAILEESKKAIEDVNRVLHDCSFGYIDINQIDIFIPNYNLIPDYYVNVIDAPCMFLYKYIVRYKQGKKAKKLLYGQCQKIYGSISILSKQENQNTERSKYLNYIKYILEHSIQYLEVN